MFDKACAGTREHPFVASIALTDDTVETDMRVGGVVAAVLVCATLMGAGMAVQQTAREPGIDVFSPEKRLVPGEETQLGLVVTNDGTEPATAATLEVGDENAPLRVLTDRVPVGTVPPGHSDPFPFGFGSASGRRRASTPCPFESATTPGRGGKPSNGTSPSGWNAVPDFAS